MGALQATTVRPVADAARNARRVVRLAIGILRIGVVLPYRRWIRVESSVGYGDVATSPAP
jgi:hypothetical protein